MDGVKVYRPSPQTDAHVENELDVHPSHRCMIVRHAGDTLAAGAAGREAALIRRPGHNIL